MAVKIGSKKIETSPEKIHKSSSVFVDRALPLLLLAGCCHALGSDIVKTDSGALRCGTVGAATRQCLGVPFAAPPVGPLRWRAPSNASSWSGVRDATKRAPLCIQGGRPPVANQTDEDCLYLDIYTPAAAPPQQQRAYPVVIWLHGGSYSTGSPQNASMLVELTQDVVWVGGAPP